jgi:threonine dehydrogenase-like Zn-dependent dehydrogenase
LKVGQRIATEPIIHCGYCRYCQAGLTNICPNSRLLGSHHDGCMSEFANLPENVCYPVSDNLPDKQVPFLEVVGVAVHALERVGSVMGKSCAIVGPGAIGLSTLLVLKAVGASEITVFGTTRSGKRLQKAQELGATETFMIDQEVPQHLKGQFDFVFEAAGKPMALVHSAQLAALGGKICMIGAYDEPVPLLFNTMVRSKEVDMLSSRARTPQSWERTVALVAQGRIDLSVFATEVVPLREAAAGFQRAASGDSFKVMLDCQDVQ